MHRFIPALFSGFGYKTFFIEVEKKKYEANMLTQTLHDPDNEIIKS